MIKEVAEKTKKFGLMYFPIALMGIMGIGMGFQTLSYAVETVWVKIVLAVISLIIFGFALYLCVKLLVEIGNSIKEDEKRSNSKSTSKKSSSSKASKN